MEWQRRRVDSCGGWATWGWRRRTHCIVHNRIRHRGMYLFNSQTNICLRLIDWNGRIDAVSDSISKNNLLILFQAFDKILIHDVESISASARNDLEFIVTLYPSKEKKTHQRFFRVLTDKEERDAWVNSLNHFLKCWTHTQPTVQASECVSLVEWLAHSQSITKFVHTSPLNWVMMYYHKIIL